MTAGPSSQLRSRLKLLSWPTVLIAVVVVRAISSYILEPGSSLLTYGVVSYFLLLLLAAGFAVRNAIQSSLGSRPFWILFALGQTLWLLDQGIFPLSRVCSAHRCAGQFDRGSVAVSAYRAVYGGSGYSSRPGWFAAKLYRVMLNSILLLAFWAILYVYAVSPYRYLFSNGTTYALRFDILYLVENLTLIAVVGILSLRVQYPWKMIYLHLLGASAVYALSSAVANTAIDSGGYVYGKVYGLGLTASACWFVWIPVCAR